MIVIEIYNTVVILYSIVYIVQSHPQFYKHKISFPLLFLYWFPCNMTLWHLSDWEKYTSLKHLWYVALSNACCLHFPLKKTDNKIRYLNKMSHLLSSSVSAKMKAGYIYTETNYRKHPGLVLVLDRHMEHNGLKERRIRLPESPPSPITILETSQSFLVILKARWCWSNRNFIHSSFAEMHTLYCSWFCIIAGRIPHNWLKARMQQFKKKMQEHEVLSSYPAKFCIQPS